MVGKISRNALMSAVAGSVIFAGIALAQAPSTPAQVNKWTADNKISSKTNGVAAPWITLGATPDGILYQTVISTQDANGIGKLALRMELFTAAPASSELYEFELDCGKKELRQVLHSTFAAHNLSGAKQDDTAALGWEPAADHILGGAAQQVCALARPAAVAARDPNAPDLNDPNGVTRWMTANGVTQGGTRQNPDWILLGGLPAEGALLYQSKVDESKSVSKSIPRIVFRMERWSPLTTPAGVTLSETRDYDLNCVTNQFRKVAVMQYPNHGLTGTPTPVSVPEEQYRPVASDAIMNASVKDLCALVDVLQEVREPNRAARQQR